MGERVRYGLITFILPQGWTREASPSLWFALDPSTHDTGPSSRQYSLSSPRAGEGRLCLTTIAMPEDMGAFDCERLRKLVDQKPTSPIFSVLMGEPFDRTEWSEGGVSCVGRTRVRKPQIVPSQQGAATTEDPENPLPSPASVARWQATSPAIQRDWHLAFETDMANAWYSGMNADEAAADIADCEDLLRSIRFNRAS